MVKLWVMVRIIGNSPILMWIIPQVLNLTFLLGKVESFIPQGVAGATKAKVNTVRKRYNINGCTESTEKRVTRSQTKQCKESMVRSKRASTRRLPSKGGRDESPQVSESAETTVSMLKLAEEALEVVEMLGVKVIANKENAVKRITQSLKSERISRPTCKVQSYCVIARSTEGDR